MLEMMFKNASAADSSLGSDIEADLGPDEQNRTVLPAATAFPLRPTATNAAAAAANPGVLTQLMGQDDTDREIAEILARNRARRYPSAGDGSKRKVDVSIRVRESVC